MRLQWSFSSDTCELEAIPQRKKKQKKKNNKQKKIVDKQLQKCGPGLTFISCFKFYINAFYEYVMNSGDNVLLCTGKSLKDLSKDGME